MLDKLTDKDGVQLDEGMHHDLQSIMNEMTNKVRDQHSDDSFRRIFWESQLEAMQTKDHRQICWHPALIKWCLHLKLKSTGAYHALRSTGILTLHLKERYKNNLGGVYPSNDSQFALALFACNIKSKRGQNQDDTIVGHVPYNLAP